MRPCARVESTGMVYYAHVVENPVGVCLAVESRLIHQDLRREANARTMVDCFVSGNREKHINRLLAAGSVHLGPGIVARVLPNAWHDSGFAEIGFADGRGVYYVCRNFEVLRRALFEMSKGTRAAFRFEAIDVLCWLEDKFVASGFAVEHSDAFLLRVDDASISVSLRVYTGIVATVRCAEAHYVREFKRKEDVVPTMATVSNALLVMRRLKGRVRVFDDFRNEWVAFALCGECFSEADVLGFLLLEQSFDLPQPYLSSWCRLKTPFEMDKRGGAIRAAVLMNERYVLF